MLKEKQLPIERFEARLAQELEERTEFVDWSASGSVDSDGTVTVEVSGDLGSWP